MSPAFRRSPTQQETISMVLLVTLSVAPHFLHMNYWIMGFFASTLILRIISIKQGHTTINKFLLFILTGAGFVTVVISYSFLTNRRIGVALLVIMLGLKIFELNQKRDHYITTFVCLFALITQFLFDQSMSMASYVLLILVGLIIHLQSISRQNPSLMSKSSFRKAVSLLVQAIPIAIVLFVFFPRFIGPLWNLGLDSDSGITGLSDSITPGSISDLIQSKAVAFRVEFKNEVPENKQLYWRGPVLWNTDGRRWTRGSLGNPSAGKQYKPPTFTAYDKAIQYQVTVEPSKNKWLYALDLPAIVPVNSRVSSDFQIVTDKVVEKRYRYNASSYLNYNTGHLSQAEMTQALQVPNNVTPRMQDLVNGWKRKSQSSVDIVNQGLAHYREQTFYYTLRPPKLFDNPTDEFLFDTKRGFCEHYATSFVTLMRMAGVPARVVTGYQGGEFNPMGNYLIVRQSDAHAWSEIWLPNRGWVRADPTAMVAPNRIERHFDFELDDSLALGTPFIFKIKESDLLKDIVKQFSLAYDMANTSWNQWILGYSNDRQNRMMDLLGLEFLKGRYLGIGMIIGVMMISIIITYAVWYGSRQRVDKVQKYYLKFCAKLAKKGVNRHSYEGPNDFSHRVVNTHPEWEKQVTNIIHSYISLRYQERFEDGELQKFATQIRAFRP